MSKPTDGGKVTTSTPGIGLTTGAELRSRRIALGISQLDLAKIAGSGANTLSLWERGMVPQRLTPALKRIVETLCRLEREAEAIAAKPRQSPPVLTIVTPVVHEAIPTDLVS